MRYEIELENAAQGMLRIGSWTDSEYKRLSLAYTALYACGYTGRGDLEKYLIIGSSFYDTVFVQKVLSEVRDRVRSPGWRVTAWSDDAIFLQGEGVRSFVDRSATERAAPLIGSEYSLETSAVVPGVAPGFLSRAGRTAPKSDQVSRIYLNIRPTGATWALGRLARQLDAEGVGFLLKVLAHPRAYRRHDACVVYVDSGELLPAIEVVRHCILGLSSGMADAVPLLTLKIAPGVGIADNPSDIQEDGLSHGQWVGSLFSSAVSRSATLSGIASDVVSAIRATGRDPERPYFRPENAQNERILLNLAW